MKSAYQYLLIIAMSLCMITIATASENDGIQQVKSSHDAKTTMEKLVNIVKSKGFNVFAQIDHSAGAKSVNMDLRPTQLLIFGNPKGGTILMQCNQNVGIDLPLKFLVTTDKSGQTWIRYNDANFIADRHKLDDCGKKVIDKVNNGLKGMSSAAAK